MIQEIKDKWLAALRGGDYKQAVGRLRGESLDGGSVGHCCLGVLLDLVDPEGWTVEPFVPTQFDKDHRKASKSKKQGTKNQYINPSFAHSLGIPAGVQRQLAMMNDRGTGFSGIADYIEEAL